jgi:hypothetical protein
MLTMCLHDEALQWRSISRRLLALSFNTFKQKTKFKNFEIVKNERSNKRIQYSWCCLMGSWIMLSFGLWDQIDQILK